jgi:hypothetical protein
LRPKELVGLAASLSNGSVGKQRSSDFSDGVTDLLSDILVLLSVEDDEYFSLEFFSDSLVNLGIELRKARLVAAENLLKPNTDALLDVGLGFGS